MFNARKRKSLVFDGWRRRLEKANAGTKLAPACSQTLPVFPSSRFIPA